MMHTRLVDKPEAAVNLGYLIRQPVMYKAEFNKTKSQGTHPYHG
jgi:hypothetical protein